MSGVKVEDITCEASLKKWTQDLNVLNIEVTKNIAASR